MNEFCLVIENKEPTLTSIQSVLTQAGILMHCVRTNREALDFMEQDPFRVSMIIMSTNLPDSDTTDFLKSLKEMGALPHIILLAIYPDPRLVIEWMKAGASDLVSVPFHEVELSLAVQQGLERYSLIENLNREIERTSQESIKTRIDIFKQHLHNRSHHAAPIKPSEIALFFPFADLQTELSEEAVLAAIAQKKMYTILSKWKKPRVLAVDDEEHVLACIEMSLYNEFEVIKAIHPQIALDTLETQGDTIDVILLDVIMPDITGDKLLKQIKAIRPDIKVIMLTSLGDPDLIVQTLRSGASDYVIKPFLNHKLVEKVAQIAQYKLIDQQLKQWMAQKQ